jgi:IgA Peptidase M64
MTTSDGYVKGVSKVVDHGESSVKWALLIFGDGYREMELPKFETDVQDFINKLYNTKPFDQLWNGINIYRVDVVSIESGADDPTACGGTGAMPKTYFDASFCTNGSKRLLTVNEFTVRSTANVAVPEWDMLMVIVNSPIYGGSGGSVAVFSNTFGASEIGIHEMGHTGFGLADEYEFYLDCTSGETGHDVYIGSEPRQPNVTIDVNKNSIKWRKYILDSTPLPTTSNADCTKCDPQQSPVQPGIVGAFEGAHTFHCGVYRPEFNCKMREQRYPFCSVCQERIIETLFSYISSRNLINNPLIDVREFDMDVEGDNVYVTWSDNRLGAFGDAIILAYSFDKGTTFTITNISGVPIDPSSRICNTNPRITAYGEDVYVMMKSRIEGYNIKLYVRASHDNGKTFGDWNYISHGELYYSEKTLTAYSNYVYVLYQDYSPIDKSSAALIRVSDDKGNFFRSPIQLSNLDNVELSKMVLVYDIAYVVWLDRNHGISNFKLRISRDGGLNFDAPITLQTKNSLYLWWGDIAKGDRNVYLTWLEGFGYSQFDDLNYNQQIFCRAILNNGTSLGPIVQITRYSGGGREFRSPPLITASGNNVYVIWLENKSVYLSVSTDNGNTFSSPKIISANLTGSCFGPRLIASGNSVYVIWAFQGISSPVYDIFLTVSTDNGNTFSNPTSISTHPYSTATGLIVEEPVIGVYAIWYSNQIQDPPWRNKNLFFKRLQ